MATVLTYNGIQFDEVTTLDFSQRPVTTEDKVQVLYWELSIKIRGYFNKNLHPGSDNMNEAPQATWTRVATCLLTPRQSLTFTQDGTSLLPSAAGNPDAKGGPYPEIISATQITSNTWEVEFAIKTYVPSCCNTQKTTPALLANRWSESVSIDALGYTTVSRKGIAHFRYDLLALNGQSADSYRQEIWAACPLRPGFIRTAMDVALQSDGMAFSYTITDKEVFAMYPEGVAKCQASWKISTQKGAIFAQTVHVKVEGYKTTPKSTLYTAAAKIVEAVLGNISGQPIFQGEWDDELFENSVSSTITTMKSAKKKALAQLQTMKNVARIGPWATADNNFNGRDPGSRGSARLQIVSSILGDPCISTSLVIANPKAGFDKSIPGQIGNIK